MVIRFNNNVVLEHSTDLPKRLHRHLKNKMVRVLSLAKVICQLECSQETLGFCLHPVYHVILKPIMGLTDSL